MVQLEDITYRDFMVTVRSDSNWFTAYHGDRVIGTIARPTRNERKWAATYMDGEQVAKCIGPRTALIRLASEHFRRLMD